MKHTKIVMVLCVAIIMTCGSLASVAFAGEYESGIDAFQYGEYSIPAYEGNPAENVNGSIPIFFEEEMVKEAFVQYGELDELGRCTVCYGDLNQSLMPTGERGSISSVTPTGWVQAKYDIVSGGWLYNRCHLIGWQLTGADLNTMTTAELKKDLITGTRYLNVGTGSTGMVEYENYVASYLNESPDNYFLYRVTPVFADGDLVARGVLMEGESVDTPDMCYCVFCYNVQPGISIDYETGNSMLTSQVVEVTDINTCDFNISPIEMAYNGKNRTPTVTITDGDTILHEEVDYAIAFNNNVLPGKASVNIAGIGLYKGSNTLIFYIVPAKGKIKKVASKKNGINITATKKRGADGYQFAYRKAGKTTWKTFSRVTNTAAIKSLKKNKKYKVRVRAYVKIDGTRHYGAWSEVVTCKTKK